MAGSQNAHYCPADQLVELESGVGISVLGGTVTVPVDLILDCCKSMPSASVIAAGSLIEGLGNSFSDIDVYAFCENLPEVANVCMLDHHRVIDVNREVATESKSGKVRLIHTVVPHTGIKIDVEFREWREITALLESLDAIYSYSIANPVLLSKMMTYREKQLLNRLFNCVVLSGADGLVRIDLVRARSRFLYLNYRWHASDFSDLLDLMGAWQALDIERAVDLARDNMAKQALSLIALSGQTNCSRKWLVNLLDRLPSDLDRLAARVRSLLLMPGCDSADGRRRYVTGTLDLCDEIFAMTPQLMARYSDWPKPEEALEKLDSNLTKMDHTTAYARLEHSYRTKPYGRTSIPCAEFLNQKCDSFEEAPLGSIYNEVTP